MKRYQHLKKEDRFYIWHALRDGKTQKQIADALGRHPATICREIKRNTPRQSYMREFKSQVQFSLD